MGRAVVGVAGFNDAALAAVARAASHLAIVMRTRGKWSLRLEVARVAAAAVVSSSGSQRCFDQKRNKRRWCHLPGPKMLVSSGRQAQDGGHRLFHRCAWLHTAWELLRNIVTRWGDARLRVRLVVLPCRRRGIRHRAHPARSADGLHTTTAREVLALVTGSQTELLMSPQWWSPCGLARHVHGAHNRAQAV